MDQQNVHQVSDDFEYFTLDDGQGNSCNYILSSEGQQQRQLQQQHLQQRHHQEQQQQLQQMIQQQGLDNFEHYNPPELESGENDIMMGMGSDDNLSEEQVHNLLGVGPWEDIARAGAETDPYTTIETTLPISTKNQRQSVAVVPPPNEPFPVQSLYFESSTGVETQQVVYQDQDPSSELVQQSPTTPTLMKEFYFSVASHNALQSQAAFAILRPTTILTQSPVSLQQQQVQGLAQRQQFASFQLQRHPIPQGQEAVLRVQQQPVLQGQQLSLQGQQLAFQVQQPVVHGQQLLLQLQQGAGDQQQLRAAQLQQRTGVQGQPRALHFKEAHIVQERELPLEVPLSLLQTKRQPPPLQRPQSQQSNQKQITPQKIPKSQQQQQRSTATSVIHKNPNVVSSQSSPQTNQQLSSPSQSPIIIDINSPPTPSRGSQFCSTVLKRNKLNVKLTAYNSPMNCLWFTDFGSTPPDEDAQNDSILTVKYASTIKELKVMGSHIWASVEEANAQIAILLGVPPVQISGSRHPPNRRIVLRYNPPNEQEEVQHAYIPMKAQPHQVSSSQEGALSHTAPMMTLNLRGSTQSTLRPRTTVAQIPLTSVPKLSDHTMTFHAELGNNQQTLMQSSPIPSSPVSLQSTPGVPQKSPWSISPQLDMPTPRPRNRPPATATATSTVEVDENLKAENIYLRNVINTVAASRGGELVVNPGRPFNSDYFHNTESIESTLLPSTTNTADPETWPVTSKSNLKQDYYKQLGTGTPTSGGLSTAEQINLGISMAKPTKTSSMKRPAKKAVTKRQIIPPKHPHTAEESITSQSMVAYIPSGLSVTSSNQLEGSTGSEVMQVSSPLPQSSPLSTGKSSKAGKKKNEPNSKDRKPKADSAKKGGRKGKISSTEDEKIEDIQDAMAAMGYGKETQSIPSFNEAFPSVVSYSNGLLIQSSTPETLLHTPVVDGNTDVKKVTKKPRKSYPRKPKTPKNLSLSTPSVNEKIPSDSNLFGGNADAISLLSAATAHLLERDSSLTTLPPIKKNKKAKRKANDETVPVTPILKVKVTKKRKTYSKKRPQSPIFFSDDGSAYDASIASSDAAQTPDKETLTPTASISTGSDQGHPEAKLDSDVTVSNTEDPPPPEEPKTELKSLEDPSTEVPQPATVNKTTPKIPNTGIRKFGRGRPPGALNRKKPNQPSTKKDQRSIKNLKRSAAEAAVDETAKNESKRRKQSPESIHDESEVSEVEPTSKKGRGRGKKLRMSGEIDSQFEDNDGNNDKSGRALRWDPSPEEQEKLYAHQEFVVENCDVVKPPGQCPIWRIFRKDVNGSVTELFLQKFRPEEKQGRVFYFGTANYRTMENGLDKTFLSTFLPIYVVVLNDSDVLQIVQYFVVEKCRVYFHLLHMKSTIDLFAPYKCVMHCILAELTQTHGFVGLILNDQLPKELEVYKKYKEAWQSIDSALMDRVKEIVTEIRLPQEILLPLQSFYRNKFVKIKLTSETVTPICLACSRSARPKPSSYRIDFGGKPYDPLTFDDAQDPIQAPTVCYFPIDDVTACFTCTSSLRMLDKLLHHKWYLYAALRSILSDYCGELGPKEFMRSTEVIECFLKDHEYNLRCFMEFQAALSEADREIERLKKDTRRKNFRDWDVTHEDN